MKIGYTAYPFMGLPATQKPSAARGMDDPLRAADACPPSVCLPAATLKCLQTIERMTSDIMNMTGDSLSVEAKGCTEQVSAGSPFKPVITKDDILVYFSPAASGPEGEEGLGEIFVVKDMTGPPLVDGEGVSQEDALTALANDVARKVSFFAAGLSVGTMDLDSGQVREKFIISVETVDDVPVPSIIRHDRSGEAAIFREGTGEAGDATVPVEVTRIAALLASLPVDPSVSAREMGQTVSRLISGGKDSGDEQQDKGAQDPDAAPVQVAASPVAPPAKPFGSVVTFIGTSSGAGRIEGAQKEAENTAGKMAALSEAVNEFVAGSVSGMEEAAGDEASAAAAANVAVKEAMKQALAASLAGAVKHAAGMNGPDTPKTLGIDLDERGLLAVDAAVLRDSLSGSKGETVRFVHDFAASLHDRVSHNAYAFAGAYAGADKAVLDAPSGKERTSGDDTDRKVEFEKRLNELRVLLKSSYELKDSFMRREFAGQDGQDEDGY